MTDQSYGCPAAACHGTTTGRSLVFSSENEQRWNVVQRDYSFYGILANCFVNVDTQAFQSLACRHPKCGHANIQSWIRPGIVGKKERKERKYK